MRPILLAVVIGGLSFGEISTSSADGARWETNWIFRVEYSTGQFSESADPAGSVSVLMYTGASWRCRRDAVSLTDSGKLVGGFYCSQPAGTGQVFITAYCEPNGETGGFGSASISDTTSKASMKLSSSCVTKLIRSEKPAPARAPVSIDKNL